MAHAPMCLSEFVDSKIVSRKYSCFNSYSTNTEIAVMNTFRVTAKISAGNHLICLSVSIYHEYFGALRENSTFNFD